MDERERILEAILDVGEIMLIGGAEVSRVEDTVSRMSGAYGFTKADVYVTPVVIVATVRDNSGDIHTQCRRVMNTSPDLTRVEKCNALSRKICSQVIPLDELRDAVEEIRRTPLFPAWITFAAYGIMCGGFAVLFGGGAPDAVCAGICGLILFVIQQFCRRLRMQDMVLTLTASLAIGFAAVMMTELGLTDSPDMTIMGTIMPMISGLALVTALRDMINNDLTSGVTGLLAALVRALMIALGCGLVLLWWQGPSYEAAVSERLPLLVQMAKDTIPCALSCAACAATFHLTGKLKYAVLSLGAVVSYYGYLITMYATGNSTPGLIVGTLLVLIHAEVIARTMKTPIVVLMVPMLIPMIPGGDLYRTMVNLVIGNQELTAYYLRLVSSEAGGMAFAIILETSFMQIFMRLHRSKA